MVTHRKIIHIDMDAFYASVEQRDNPRLKGKPVIVGSDPDKRGVVCTCSYEARKFGVRSAMPSRQAAKLCPHGVFLYPRFEAYRQVSQQIREIFYEVTDLVEPLSLDEAYLDVTHNKKGESSATRLAIEIKKRIFKETKLTCSAGVSYNKFLAKVASEYKKPNGLFVIRPEKAKAFLEELPIEDFYGVGKVTKEKMHALGIYNGEDLKQAGIDKLTHYFGRSGVFYYSLALGEDDREVNPYRERKSYGKEVTLEKDLLEKEELLEVLAELSKELWEYLEKKQQHGRTITLKVKYADFTQVTRRRTFNEPLNGANRLLGEAAALLDKTDAGMEPVRLLGIAISNCPPQDDTPRYCQLLLF